MFEFCVSKLLLAAALFIQFMNQKSREIRVALYLLLLILARSTACYGTVIFLNIILVQQKYLSSYLKTWNKKGNIPQMYPNQTKSTTDVSKNNLSASFIYIWLVWYVPNSRTTDILINPSLLQNKLISKDLDLLRIASKASTWWFDWFPRSLAPSCLSFYLVK